MKKRKKRAEARIKRIFRDRSERLLYYLVILLLLLALLYFVEVWALNWLR